MEMEIPLDSEIIEDINDLMGTELKGTSVDQTPTQNLTAILENLSNKTRTAYTETPQLRVHDDEGLSIYLSAMSKARRVIREARIHNRFLRRSVLDTYNLMKTAVQTYISQVNTRIDTYVDVRQAAEQRDIPTEVHVSR